MMGGLALPRAVRRSMAGITALVLLATAGCSAPPAVEAGQASVGGTVRFYEINLAMEAGDTFAYEWSVDAPNATVHFDVHTHRDGAVQYAVQGRAANGTGSYEHPTDGEVSLLWTEPDPGPVAFTYWIEGSFVVRGHASR